MPGTFTLGKSVPYVGLAVSAAVSTPRVMAAQTDDAVYASAMEAMGFEPRFPNQSTARELAIIAGEEAGGELVGAAGAGIGAWFGGWGAIPGALIGGLVGDYAGGSLAASRFDSAVCLSDQELIEMFSP